MVRSICSQRLKITVPSLSSMFLLVRAGYELVESSTMWHLSSILPFSAFRPLRTYPPGSAFLDRRRTNRVEGKTSCICKEGLECFEGDLIRERNGQGRRTRSSAKKRSALWPAHECLFGSYRSFPCVGPVSASDFLFRGSSSIPSAHAIMMAKDRRPDQSPCLILGRRARNLIRAR